MTVVYYAIVILSIVTVGLILCLIILMYRECTKPREKKDEQYKSDKLTVNPLKTENEQQSTNQKKRTFLTPNEREFKKVLHQYLPDNIEIHCNVRVQDLLEIEVVNKLDPDKKNDRAIMMWHVDYVLINKESYKIVLVVELDDNSHNDPSQKNKDDWKDRILKESKVRIKRVPDRQKNDPAIMNDIVEFCKNQIT